MRPLAVGRSFSGLSAPPVACPYRAEQATGLAGGYDLQVEDVEAPKNGVKGKKYANPTKNMQV